LCGTTGISTFFYNIIFSISNDLPSHLLVSFFPIFGATNQSPWPDDDSDEDDSEEESGMKGMMQGGAIGVVPEATLKTFWKN